MTSLLILSRSDAVKCGDRWEHTFHFTEVVDGETVGVDVSGYDWSCVLAHDKNDPVKIVAAIDTSRAADPDNEITVSIEAATTDGAVGTAAITANMLTGELQAEPDDTWIEFRVPVFGQINTTGA